MLKPSSGAVYVPIPQYCWSSQVKFPNLTSFGRASGLVGWGTWLVAAFILSVQSVSYKSRKYIFDATEGSSHNSHIIVTCATNIIWWSVPTSPWPSCFCSILLLNHGEKKMTNNFGWTDVRRPPKTKKVNFVFCKNKLASLVDAIVISKTLGYDPPTHSVTHSLTGARRCYRN